MSGSFGSSLYLAEWTKETEEIRAEIHRSSPHTGPIVDDDGFHDEKKSALVDEDTPLVGKVKKAYGGLNATLLTTVTVVTVGSSFQFGYGTGVMNNSKDFIMDYFHNHGKDYTLMGWGTTVSCYGIGGLLGSVIGPKVIGKCCGRRATLLFNNLFLVISSLLIAFAPLWWWQAIGRIFVGITAGVATAVVPTYFSEISPVEVRGAIGTMHQLGITIGILVSQLLSTPSLNLMGSEERWRWLFFVPVLCGAVELIVLPFCPESPSYLYITKGQDEAREAIVKLQSENVADEYLGYIREEITAEAIGHNDMTVIELFRDKTLRKQLIVGVTVQLMMQFSGIDAVFYYSTSVFKQAAVADPELATTCLGIINVIVTIFAVKFMDKAGRKVLLVYSWIGMMCSYTLLTTSFVLKPYVGFMDQLSVVATTGVIIFFAFGPGCIAWFIIAEIFPLYARDTAMVIGIFINWIANWFVAFTFPILLEYTQPFTFLVFVGTTTYFLHFTLRYVPETKGLTISQVTKEFDSIKLWMC
eukprot:CAMPEP_0185729732 /NCGR_PEP_ID=MMETSP1171-20130828/7002_1 /TAXON_ID=374046 /ORGANISM="Helicotheca tamensis, Strain CCMP826" /LENGTH=526 /DNA_ID=CAMNT_0028398637 /DNA_START=116 /DNA_END=1696 /DNA_ORIENTATION=+